MKHRWGRVLVDEYYYYSPAIASMVVRHEGIKAAVRTLLMPVVGAAWMVNTHGKGLMVVVFLGLIAVGLIIRGRENMRAICVALAVFGLLVTPLLASANDTPAGKSAQALIASNIQQGIPLVLAVERLIQAGLPEAEVVRAAVKACKEKEEVADVIESAIKAGADPFTVAYAAKGAGVDLREVVRALETVNGTMSGSGETDMGFQPPSPPVGMGVSSLPLIVTGSGSSWGSSHYVASPSL